MGTTVQVEQGRWSFLDARLFVGAVPHTGSTAHDVKIAYKKYGDFTFTTKPLNGAQTTLSVAGNTDDISVTLADSAIFPRTAGTLILDPAGAGSGPEIIDFTSNTIALGGVLNVPSGIQTAGAPPFPIGTVVQFSYATALTYSVLAGATSIIVDDSTFFPPGFGRIRIYNVSNSEEVELSANITSNGELTFKTALGNPYAVGDKVELVEWYELPGGVAPAIDGYYTTLFNPYELDTLDQFLYTIVQYSGGGPSIEEFERTIDIIRATSAESEPAPTLSTCVIKDHILDLSGLPIQNTGISARLLALPAIMSSVGVYDEIVSTKTDANGFFQLTLIQGATVDIVIPSTGYRRTIVVPSTTSANLFEI